MFGGADDTATTTPVADQQNTTQTGVLDASSAVPAAAEADAAAPASFDAGTYATDDSTAAATAVTTVQPAAAEGSDDLMTIKQQALQQLSPLVGHLDQTPEEKFRTTMMLIQASDNADLIKEAYEAAQQIPDEKIRAQALLDVVNEINYFTQHEQQQ